MKTQILQPVRVFFCVAGIGWVVTILLWFAAPSTRSSLSAEGLFMENLSAAAFLTSFFLGIAGILRHPGRRENLILAVIPLLGFLAFCDETELILLINHGQPIILYGYEIDGIHDFVTFAAKLWSYHGNQVTDWLGTGLISALVVTSFLLRRHYMPWIMTRIRALPALDFLRFAVIAIGAAVLLDLNIWVDEFAFFLEELLETTGAVSLVFGALEIHRAPVFDATPEVANKTGP